MDLVPTHENPVANVGFYTLVLGTAIFVFKKWLSKINPLTLLQKLAMAINRPIVDAINAPILVRLDQQDREFREHKLITKRMSRVMQKIKGAQEALEQVEAEEAEEARWSRVSNG